MEGNQARKPKTTCATVDDDDDDEASKQATTPTGRPTSYLRRDER